MQSGCDTILDFRETEMGPSSSHLENCRGFSSKDLLGGLPVSVQLVPHHMHAHNPTVRVELEERTNLDLPRRTLTRPWGTWFGTRHDG
jgi:hypothetical protein